MLRIVEVKTKKQSKEFLSFAGKLYRDNKYYVPDLYTEEEDYFNPKVNPAYEYCEVKRFLAYERGRVVGRIAAILNKKYNEKPAKSACVFRALTLRTIRRQRKCCSKPLRISQRRRAWRSSTADRLFGP